MANFLDKTIGFFSPKAGSRRLAFRRKMEILDGARGYEGASDGRLAQGWAARTQDANGEIARAGQTLRDRSRDLVRNNSLAAKIVTTHANNFVGPGIVPRAKTGNPSTDKVIDDLFDEWSTVCHVEGSADFHGMAYQMARMLVQDGEVFVRERTRRMEDGLPVPLQLQVLDSEYCDWSKGQMPGGNPIVNGIEYDPIGRRRGYWLFSQNPKSSFRITATGNVTSNFVPAESVVHLYEPQTNQARGVPWMAPVMTELKDLRDYELAENIRKKLEACAVGTIIPADDNSEDPNIGLYETDDPSTNRAAVTDIHGNPFERMEPGMFAVLNGGKDIRFNTPAVSQGIEAYIRTRHRSIAAGVRMPYELLTGDYSQANFASGKLGILEYQRFIGVVQWHIMIPQALARIYGWFIKAAKMAGKIPADLVVKVEWTPPEFQSITRLDDARADMIEMRIGKRSPQEIVGQTGRDWKVVLQEIDEYFQEVDKTAAGLIFDSDPRKMSINGQIQGIADTAQNGDVNAPSQ